jgi:hypothetical protein
MEAEIVDRARNAFAGFGDHPPGTKGKEVWAFVPGHPEAMIDVSADLLAGKWVNRDEE